MKKFYSILVMFGMSFSFSNLLFAQTETDTTFKSQMNYIFANVDVTKTPYGILRDYGMEFTNIEIIMEQQS